METSSDTLLIMQCSFSSVFVVVIAIRGWSGGERHFFLRGCGETGVLVVIVVAILVIVAFVKVRRRSGQFDD